MNAETKVRAAYDVETVNDCICITDLGGPTSVTNDMEAVVQDLGERGFLINSKPIIYRDSAGRYDTVTVEGGRFIAFGLINERDRDLAIDVARIRHEARMRASDSDADLPCCDGPVPPDHLESFLLYMDECDEQFGDLSDGAWCAVMTESAQAYLESVLEMSTEQAGNMAHEAWLQWCSAVDDRGRE